MKKKCLISMMVVALLACSLSACGAVQKKDNTKVEQGTVKQDSVPDTNEKNEQNETSEVEEKGNTSELNELYVSEDTVDSNLAAIAFLGSGNQEKDTNFSAFCAKYGLDATQFENVVDIDDCEWYAILPKYKGEEITVSHVELNDNGELEKTKQLISTTKPVLVCCNVSDIIPSVKVTIAYNGEQVSFNPFISLDTGLISTFDRIYSVPEMK